MSETKHFRLISLTFIAVFWTTTASAGQPIYHVQQVDPNFDVGAMAGPGVQIHRIPKSALPSIETRDRVIHEAGLQKDASGWDELDKDLLYLRAQKADTPDALAKQYPDLEPKNLGAFMKLVKRAR